MTRYSDRLKMLVAASAVAPVGAVKARGPVSGLMLGHTHHNRTTGP